MINPALLNFETLATGGALYALLSLDQVAVGPFLVSRPMMIGTVLGLFWHEPWMGFLTGVTLDLLWIGAPPTGTRCLNPSFLTAVVVYWQAVLPFPARSLLSGSLILAIPAATFLCRLDVWARKQTPPLASFALSGLRSGRDNNLWVALSVFAMFWFIKSWVMFLVLTTLGTVVLERWFSLMPWTMARGFEIAGDLMPLAAFVTAAHYFVTRLWQRQSRGSGPVEAP